MPHLPNTHQLLLNTSIFHFTAVLASMPRHHNPKHSLTQTWLARSSEFHFSRKFSRGPHFSNISSLINFLSKKRHRTCNNLSQDSMSNHLANAIGYPRTMVVKLFNTTITSGTVLCTKWSDNLMTIKSQIMK